MTEPSKTAPPRRLSRDRSNRAPRGSRWIPIALGAFILAGGVGFAVWHACRTEPGDISPWTPEQRRRYQAAGHNHRADEAYLAQRFKEAEKEARAAVGIAPAWSYPHLFLALAIELSSPQEASAEIDRAFTLLATGETWEEGDLAAAYGLRGRLKEGRRDLEGALADYRKALESDPEATFVLGSIAVCEARLGQFDQAFTDADRGVSLNPGLALPLAHRGLIRFMKDRFAEAADDYAAAIKLAPSAGAFRTQHGFACIRLGRIDESEKDFNAALAIDPNAPDANMGLGRVCFERGDLDKALELLNFAADHAPPDAPEIWFERALVRAKKGDHAGSIADYRKALEVAPPWWPSRKQVEGMLQKEDGQESR